MVAAVIAVLGFVTPGWFKPATVFDKVALQDGVKKILVENYKTPDVGDVSCPADQAVKANTTFDCTVTVKGEQKKITVSVKDDSGTYEVPPLQ